MNLNRTDQAPRPDYRHLGNRAAEGREDTARGNHRGQRDAAQDRQPSSFPQRGKGDRRETGVDRSEN